MTPLPVHVDVSSRDLSIVYLSSHSHRSRGHGGGTCRLAFQYILLSGPFYNTRKCIQRVNILSTLYVYITLGMVVGSLQGNGLADSGNLWSTQQVISVWFAPVLTTPRLHNMASMMRFMLLASTGVSYLLFRKCINGPSTGILPSAGDNPLILATAKLQYTCTALLSWQCMYGN